MPIERRERIGVRSHKKKRPDAEVVVLPVAPIPGIPEPYRPLLRFNGEEGPGMQLWRRLWTAGAGWLREDDGELVQIVCEQEDERAVLRRMVFSNPDDWRARTSLRTIEKLITENLSMLGFTPTDRARMGFRSATVDPLDEFRKRVESKRQKA